MNMKDVRRQFEDMEVQQHDFTTDVMNRIQIRSKKRKVRLRIATIAIALIITIGATQFQHISAYANSIYRNIAIRLNNDMIILDDLDSIPIEIKDVNWLGHKKGNRAGVKSYASIEEAEEELKINILTNSISRSDIYHFGISFMYFENINKAELSFSNHFIGDLKGFKEIITEENNLRISYTADETTLYQSPLSMKITFLTGIGRDFENIDWESFDFEEKYISSTNGIAAYLMKYVPEFELNEDQTALRAAAGESANAKTALFVHENLLYTISGDAPFEEFKRIVDSFIVE
ncbi:MAG: hypothetical protein GX783_01005 [Clostridiales bacterium]|nr:hypothetical protein [Clostridiales bacterium]